MANLGRSLSAQSFPKNPFVFPTISAVPPRAESTAALTQLAVVTATPAAAIITISIISHTFSSKFLSFLSTLQPWLYLNKNYKFLFEELLIQPIKERKLSRLGREAKNSGGRKRRMATRLSH
jgi:hypothetical protein